MHRIRSPFGPSANPDSNRAAFPPPFSQIRLPCPLLTPMSRSATLADRPLANRPRCFVSPPLPAGSRIARDPRATSRVLGKPVYSQSGILSREPMGLPGYSSTTFHAQPPNLHHAPCSNGQDFRLCCALVPVHVASIRFLYISPRFCVRPPSSSPHGTKLCLSLP